MLRVLGFSQYTSLPARAAIIEAVACQFGPVAISTASMSSRSSSSRKSDVGRAIGVAVLVIDDLLDRRAPIRLGVGDGDELHVGLGQKAAEHIGASIPQPDAADDDPITGGDGSVPTQRLWRERTSARPTRRRPRLPRRETFAGKRSDSSEIAWKSPSNYAEASKRSAKQ
jgi:hypothetical protein